MVKVEEVSEEKHRAVRGEADKAGGKSVVIQRLRLNEQEKNVNRALFLPVAPAADVIGFGRHDRFSFLVTEVLCSAHEPLPAGEVGVASNLQGRGPGGVSPK